MRTWVYPLASNNYTFQPDVNDCYIIGKLEEELIFDENQSKIWGRVIVPRFCGLIDQIPVSLPLEYKEKIKILQATEYKYAGTYQTLDKHRDKEIPYWQQFINVISLKPSAPIGYTNSVHLGGTLLCDPYQRELKYSKPYYFLMAVNGNGRSNYISCATGNNDAAVADMRKGDRIEFLGCARVRQATIKDTGEKVLNNEVIINKILSKDLFERG